MGLPLHAAEQKWTVDADQTLRVFGGFSVPGLDFALTGPGADTTYVPNSAARVLLGASYGDLGISLQLPNSPDQKSIDERGSSHIEDYQFRFFGHRHTHELIYQHFKGYALQGWKDARGKWPLRPDIQVRTMGYNFITSLSPAYFSNSVAFAQSGVQNEGGGSLLLWGSIARMTLSGQEAFVPSTIQAGRSYIADLSYLRTYYTMAGLGYGYTKPFFTRGYFVVSGYGGVGLGYQKALVKEVGNWEVTNLHRIGVRSGLGYNYGDHAFGLQLIVDANTTRVADGQIEQSTFNTRLFYQYRIRDVMIPYL